MGCLRCGHHHARLALTPFGFAAFAFGPSFSESAAAVAVDAVALSSSAAVAAFAALTSRLPDGWTYEPVSSTHGHVRGTDAAGYTIAATAQALSTGQVHVYPEVWLSEDAERYSRWVTQRGTVRSASASA